ncbi:MAG: hypothetical protein IKV40_02900 [Clostridia bacterium]|nr:hypothetical protein [Clostridia bacterium]
MKEYEKWTANIEAKIGEAVRKKALRASLVKKLTAVVSCVALLSGSAFAMSYFMKDDEPLYPTPDVTDTQSETPPVDTGAEPDDGPKWVTYKTETGAYSWIEGRGGWGGGFSYEFCPEGHYENVGFSAYHSIPLNLALYVNGISRDGDWSGALDKAAKKRRYEKLSTMIAGKCNGETVRGYIDEYGITREDFDHNVDLVEQYAMNLDVLYGDYDYCDEYYKYTKIFERRQEMHQSYEVTVRAIFDYENTPEGLAKDSAENDRRFGYSIPELAYHYGLSEDELRHVVEESNRYTEFDLTFDYDYSVIYNEDGTFKEELSALDVRENDFEAVVNYAAELGEAFCRIYEWEDPAEIGDVKNEGRESDNPYDCCGECIDSLAYRCEDMLEERGDKPYYPTGVLEDSPLPLKTLIDEYGLTREDIETAVSEMTEEYDINYEVLFEGTKEDALEYYSSPKHRVKKYAEMTCAIMHRFIRNHYNDRDGNGIRGEAKYDGLSMPELARVGNISREELLAIIAEVKRREEPTQVYYGGAFYQYDYDLDVIYNEDGSFKDLSGYDSGTLEAMFTGDESYIESYAE